MSGWIKFEKDLPGSIKFRRMLKRYGESQKVTVTPMTETLMTGALVRFWFYVDTHVRDDDTFDATFDEIDDLIGVPGFASSMPSEWLVDLGDGIVQVPGFLEHNGSSASERKRAAERQAKSREGRKARKRHAVSQSVTPSNKLDQTRPDQIRPDQEKNPTAAHAANGHAAALAILDKNVENFEKFKRIYPKRNGNQPWVRARRAISARIDEGSSWNEILEGATAYAAWCRATGKENTEHVMQAATFCGPEKTFLDAWPTPAGRAEIRLQGNLAAADEFVRAGATA